MKNRYRQICIFLSILVIFISFASCGSKDQPGTPEEDEGDGIIEDDGITRYHTNSFRDVEFNGVYITDEYDEPQTITLDAEIKAFGRLYISGDKVWVTDIIFNNNILIFDISGELIKKIDSLDIIPQGITSDEKGSIYIGDSLNKRIIKFDSEGNYLDEYPLTRLGSITYHGGKIYATNPSFQYKNMSGIYVLDVVTKKETHILEGVHGHISADFDGNLYIVQSWHYEWNENTQEGVESLDDEMYIQRIVNGELEEKFVRFDHTYSATGMLVYGNEIYISAANRLYKFTTDGEYCGIVYDKFPGAAFDEYDNLIESDREGFGMISSFSVDSEGNIYVYNHGDKKVYKFVKKVK